jgi:cupin 2 domain-containing protein
VTPDSIANLFRDLPAELLTEHFDELVSSSALKIERIVSNGHGSPAGFWYDQEQHEWVLLLRGRAMLKLEDPAATLIMTAGDHLLIRAHRRHRVEGTEPGTVWLAVHFSDAPTPTR